MKLSADAIGPRRRTEAILFAVGALALLGLARLGSEPDPSAWLLLALPLAGLANGAAARRAASRSIRRLATTPLGAAVLVGALALAASLAFSFHVGLPVPSVHDEFSYLLAADTFAHGRLTNPPHPLWVHFEAPHILQQPTYMSKYPPAQGLMLALGQVAFGHPIAGVWLSAGLAGGALTWMLAGWMPGRWALAGGVLAVVHPLTLKWSQSYWGGLVAVLGGALILGAFRRLVRRPRPRHAVVLGLGLGILANSRPYESLALSVPFLLALGGWLASRRGPPARVALSRIVIPLASTLLLLAGGMVYYNYRVTGDALALPYAVHQHAYATMPLLIFQAPLPRPVYRHERLERFFSGGPTQPPVRTLRGLAASVRDRAHAYAVEYFGSLLAAGLIVLLCPLERNGWQLLAILALLLFTAALGLQSWRLPHYAAPAAGLALLVAMRALRGIGRWRLGPVRVGRPLARAVWVAAFGTLALGWGHALTYRRPHGWQHERASIDAVLGQTGDKHLMMVRYARGHALGEEWIYNAADIDAAPVVWAAEMDAAANAHLLDYFRGRWIWLVEPDRPGLEVIPYSPPAVPKPAAP